MATRSKKSTINQQGWWDYYNFLTEPPIKPTPLVSKDELSLFIGRDRDIKYLQSRTAGQGITSILITGDAGIGKTTLICKLNEGIDSYIRFDLRKAGNPSLLESCIAEDLLSFASAVNGLNISDIVEEYQNIIAKTTSTQVQAGGGPLPGGLTHTTQVTITPVLSPLKARELGQKVIERLSRKLGSLTIFFDETDHLQKMASESLYEVLEFFRLASPTTIIFSTRDEAAKNGWQNPNSIERQKFLFHRNLAPLWKPGSGEAKKLLESRFEGHYTDGENWVFPLQDDTIDLVDVLSEGNVREFLRYTLTVLISGFDATEKVPLNPSFAFRELQKEYHLADLSDEDRATMDYLRINPSSTSDKSFLDHMRLHRTTLLEKLSNLKNKGLIEKRVEKSKHIYSTSRKAELFLDYT